MLLGLEGEGLAVALVPFLPALDHPAVEQHAATVVFQKVAGTGHLPRGAEKREFHSIPLHP